MAELFASYAVDVETAEDDGGRIQLLGLGGMFSAG